MDYKLHTFLKTYLVNIYFLIEAFGRIYDLKCLLYTLDWSDTFSSRFFLCYLPLSIYIYKYRSMCVKYSLPIRTSRMLLI